MEEELIELTEEDVYISDFSVEESKNPYVLCTITGPFMVIEDDNGNGRFYLRETIQKGILESEYVLRMLQYKSLLGECHHPLDRTSIWSDEACISTRELWIDSTGKYLMGRADVLDTPKGKIVDTLIRYGTKIGISARANGKGVKQSKRLVIKPENYFFKTFDIVLNPGFEEARLTAYEPDGKTPLQVYEEENADYEEKLYEEFKSQVENKTCDIDFLRKYIQYCESEKLKELLPLLEDVSTEPSEEATQAPDEILLEEISSLKSKVDYYQNVVCKNYESEISSIRAMNEELQSNLDKVTSKNEEIGSNLDSLLEEVESELSKKDEELAKTNELVALYEEKIAELDKQVGEAVERTAELSRENESLVEDYNGLVDEINSMNEEQEEPAPRTTVKSEPKHELFNHGMKALDEEVEEERQRVPVTNVNRIKLIKSIGGIKNGK